MIQRKAMEQKAKDGVSDVPKLQKGTTVASWANSMRVFLSKVPIARGISTMAYLTRKEAQAPIVAPTIAPDQPHLLKHGSVEGKYENFLLHYDVRFQNDNGTLFGYLEEVTCGTTFVSSIKNYEHTRNGSVVWLDLNK